MILALLLAGQVLPVQQTLDQIDRTFICPETLPSDEAREDANRLFIEQLMVVEKKLTVRIVIEYRQALLIKHHCTTA